MPNINSIPYLEEVDRVAEKSRFGEMFESFFAIAYRRGCCADVNMFLRHTQFVCQVF